METPSRGIHVVPGQMTAAMRVVTVAATARVPRVAIVRGGRILDERLFRDSASVTIGSSEQADIVVRAAALPASFVLIERAGDRYWLRFTRAMTGRIATKDGPIDLHTAAAHASGDALRIPLPEDARGKIVVGDVTFLFQLVAPPPVLPRPQLPLSVKSGLRLDWSLTIIAAMSFLLHFGIAGAMYSDWLDPVISADYTVSGLIDDLARLPKVAPEVQAPSGEAPSGEKEATPVANAPSHGGTHHATSSTTSRSVNDHDAASLAARADAMTMGYLTAQNGGPSVQRALDRSEVPSVDLTSAAARNVGATAATGDLKIATGGPIVGQHGPLGTLAGPTTARGPDHAGSETATAGPVIRVDARPIAVGPGVSDADRVIAALHSRLRKCYTDGLARDGAMSGKAIISAKIGPNGEVMNADVAANEGLSAGVTACLAKVIRNAQFTGNGSMTTLNVPITFVQQK